MAYFVKNISNTGDLISNSYAGIEPMELAKKLDAVFKAEGYSFSEGQPNNATYEKGNRVMRILFGAFVKYFKFSVTITQNEDKTVTVNFFKQTSGMSGGLIGMNQVKNELQRMNTVLQSV